jgi:Skp family chaperone for outer membrane proteins
MKTKVLLVIVALSVSVCAWAQRGVRIAYVDMEYILENVEEYQQASDQLEAKAQKWKLQIEQKQAVIDQMKKDLQAEKVLLTDELVAERQEEIQIKEKELIDYQQDRFGPNGDLVLQKQMLIRPIQDQVFAEVQKQGTNKKYDFIFDKSADVVMLYSQKRHDISDQVLRAISRTRKLAKPKGKKVDQNRIDRLNAEAAEDEMTDAMKERSDRAKQAQDAKAKTAEERRAQQLKLREERKKAYEERRKKLLEEREAKRKAKLEEREKAKKDNEKEDSDDSKESTGN